jgi:hypothetical protein
MWTNLKQMMKKSEKKCKGRKMNHRETETGKQQKKKKLLVIGKDKIETLG